MAEATEGTTDYKSGAADAESQAVLDRLKKKAEIKARQTKSTSIDPDHFKPQDEYLPASKDLAIQRGSAGLDDMVRDKVVTPEVAAKLRAKLVDPETDDKTRSHRADSFIGATNEDANYGELLEYQPRGTDKRGVGDVLANPVGIDMSSAFDKNKTATGGTYGKPLSGTNPYIVDQTDTENDPEYQKASAEFIGEIERDFPVEKQQEEEQGYVDRGFMGNRLAEQNMIDKIRAQRRVVNDMIKQADTPEELESIQDEMKELDDLRKDHSDHIKAKRDFRKQRKAVKRQARGRRPVQSRDTIFTPDEPAEEEAEKKAEVTQLPDTKEVAKRAMAPRAPAPEPRPGPVGGTTGMEQDESGDFVDTDQVSMVSDEDLNVDEFGNPLQSYEDEVDVVKDYGESIAPVEGDPVSEYMEDFESPAPGGTPKMGGNAKQIIRDQIVDLTGSDELMSEIFLSDGTIDTAGITDLVTREEISEDDAARILKLAGRVSPASVAGFAEPGQMVGGRMMPLLLQSILAKAGLFGPTRE
tara:strand:- start:245 stop:1822 length:1578 start_codon:yes stop_codon:yes gene_type:complete